MFEYFKILTIGLLVVLGFYFLFGIPVDQGGIPEIKAESATTQVVVSSNATPTVSNVNLNAGININLTESGTTSISATATVSDTNTYSDITSVTGRIYRSGVTSTESCTIDPNNLCSFDVWFIAEPTDVGSGWAGEHWVAWIKATDSCASTSDATNSTQTIEMNTLTALDAGPGGIDYGSLGVDETIDPLSKLLTATTTGNEAIDAYISGTDLVKSDLDSYWVQIPVASTSAGAQTDYQKEITMHYGDGNNSAGNIYCNNHCQTDFDDVYFTKSDGVTEIDYWMKEVATSDQAVFWVELPTVNATGTTDYFVYYGSSSAVTSSNGTNTFLYFDHWTSDNTGDWIYEEPSTNHHQYREKTVTSTGSYRALESSSTLEAWNAGDWDRLVVGWMVNTTSMWSSDDHVAFRWSMDTSDGATNDIIRVQISTKSGGNATTTEYISVSTSSISFSTDALSLKLKYSSTVVSYEWKNLTTDTVLATDSMTDSLYIPSPSNLSHFFNEQFDDSGGIWSWLSPTYLDFGSQPFNGGIELYTDYWLYRNYADPEPAWATPGSEEALFFIPIEKQHYATTSGVAYASGYVASSSAVLLEFTTGKPTATTSNQAQDIYWGLSIPSGTSGGTYTGENTISAQSDS